MRFPQTEGWITQLQGRRVVGHYLASTTMIQSAATGRFISLRNPLVMPSQQRRCHLVRAFINAVVSVDDDATFETRVLANKITGFTVSDGSGGGAQTPLELSGTGVASACDLQVDTGGGMLSGGTLTTTNQAFLGAVVAQASATGTDASKYAHATWEAKYGPILFGADEGLIMQFTTGSTAPGTITVFGSFEWLESEKQ